MDFDIGRFHAGDDDLFAELVAAFSPRLVPQLRRYADVDVGVDDLLQETWLRAYDKRRTFDARGSFLGWLFSVARTVGIAAVRKRMREPSTDALPAVPASYEPEGAPGDRLRDAVLALPERQRDVVILRLVEGLSTADTARALSCAVGTVKASLHQAVRKLREQLTESER